MADFLLSLLPSGTSVTTSHLELAALLVTVGLVLVAAYVVTRTTAAVAGRTSSGTRPATLPTIDDAWG